MSALSNENFTHESAPKGLYALEPSRSDLISKVAKAQERNFHECTIE